MAILMLEMRKLRGGANALVPENFLDEGNDEDECDDCESGPARIKSAINYYQRLQLCGQEFMSHASPVSSSSLS